MKAVIELADFIARAQESGADLSGCFINGTEYVYQFHKLVGREVNVGYGGDFSYEGKLRGGLTVSHISLSSVQNGPRPLRGKPVIIIHIPK